MLKDKKVMIALMKQNASLVVTKIDGKKAEFELLGGINREGIVDSEVFCNNKTAGIIRKNDKDAFAIELWEENSTKPGDILNLKEEVNCKANLLYGFNLSKQISRKLEESLNKIKDNNVKDIYFTASDSENELKSKILSVTPDVIIFVYPAKTKENFEISKGCGIVYKDGCAVTNPDLRDSTLKTANANNIAVQPYIGKETPIVEAFGIIGNGADVIPICIPVSYFGTRTEIADTNDIQAATELIFKILGE